MADTQSAGNNGSTIEDPPGKSGTKRYIAIERTVFLC